MDGQQILKVPGKIQTLAEHVYDYNRRNDIQQIEKQTGGFELRPAVVTYLEKENLRSCFFQAPMAAFYAWYRDFPFAKFFEEAVKGPLKGKMDWEYRVIFLNPSNPELTKGERCLLRWATKKVSEFYLSDKELLHRDKSRISYSVSHDATIAIFRCKNNKGSKPVLSWNGNKFVEVVSAITYRQGSDRECCMALITWLSVSQTRDDLSWRRSGLGTFMIVPVIKLCVIDGRKAVSSVDIKQSVTVKRKTLPKQNDEYHFNAKTDVNLYLQCTQDFQMRFFESCGFVHHNVMKADNAFLHDGHHLLPLSLRKSVERDGDSSFIRFRDGHKTSGYITPALYKLRGGEFKVRPRYYAIELLDSSSSADEKENGEDSKKRYFHWCDYPAYRHVESARLNDDDLKAAFRNATLIKHLLPPPMMNQIPPGSLCVRGEMLSSSRIEHTATTYMGNGEIEMMLALLLNDGRYDDAVSIVPLTYLKVISLAARAHADYEDALVALDCLRKERLKLRSNLLESKFGKTTTHSDFTDVSDESHEKWNEFVELRDFEFAFDAETENLCATKTEELDLGALKENNSKQITMVIQKVLMPNPSILDKKLLVIPQCTGKHWSAVFIFNASFIEVAQSEECNVVPDCLRPCFLRYCSMIPDGSRTVKTSQGILWFLNLAFSYAKHMKDDTQHDNGMTWEAPFGKGSIVETNVEMDKASRMRRSKMLGTTAFPSIRVHEDDVPNLPKQVEADEVKNIEGDVWNCGFGLVAAIGIIMRDIIGKDETARSHYCTMFQTASTSITEQDDEVIFQLAPGCLKPLPSVQHLVWARGDYLAALRHEWFVLFDMLAELQHNTIPRRLDSTFKVPIRFTKAKQNCTYPSASADSAEKANDAATADLMLRMRDSVPPLNLENAMSTEQGSATPPNKVTQEENSTTASEKEKSAANLAAEAYAKAAAAYKAKQEAEANAAAAKKKKTDEDLFAAAAAAAADEKKKKADKAFAAAAARAKQQAEANAAVDKKKKADEAKAAAAAKEAKAAAAKKKKVDEAKAAAAAKKKKNDKAKAAAAKAKEEAEAEVAEAKRKEKIILAAKALGKKREEETRAKQEAEAQAEADKKNKADDTAAAAKAEKDATDAKANTAAAKAKQKAEARAAAAKAKALAENEAAAAKAAALEEAKAAVKNALEVKAKVIAKRKAAEAEVQAAKEAEAESSADAQEAADFAAAAKSGSADSYAEALAIMQDAEIVKATSAAITELAQELAETAAEEERNATALAEAAAKVLADLESESSAKKKRRILEEESEDEKADEEKDGNHKTAAHKKLKASVPWLQIPDNPKDLERNTWTPNWRTLGKMRGDVRYFFGPVLEEAEEDIRTIKDNEGSIRTMQDFPQRPISSESFDAYHKKWESYKGMGSTVIKREALQKFIDGSFEEWEWSTGAQHEKDLKYFAALEKRDLAAAQTICEKEKIACYYDDLKKAILKERRFFKRQLENEFRLNDVKTVTGLRYNKTTKKFYARLQWQEERPEKSYKAKGKKVIPTERKSDDIEVSEDWVINQSGLEDDVIQYIIDFDRENGFYPVPADVEVKFNDKAIVRVQFVPESTLTVIDTSAVKYNKVAKLPGKRYRGTALAKTPPPTKKVKKAEHYLVKYNDRTVVSRTEEDLREFFTKKYLDEVKAVASKFVDIPVGDFKISHLHLHPHLRKDGAPTLKFVQDNNEDLCVSNSLASAIFNIGFCKAASGIFDFGKGVLAGGSVNTLEKVIKFATSKDVLPSWIQPKKMPLRFDWNELLCNQRIVFVGVLFASDGNSSHAVTIHGGLIYDANEVVALPLCREALDYCTSTETQKSTFVEFRRGYLLQYMGKKQKYIRQMTLQPEDA